MPDLPLDPESKKYTIINTHEGLFQYNRLPFGVASTFPIFQRFMDTLLQGIPNVWVYIDILISGSTLKEHLTTLDRVLQKLQELGLHCNRDKCLFLQTSLEFLGHHINAESISPTNEKVQAIQQASEPKNATELPAFLGLLNYYAKFLPNLFSRLSPLYLLLNKYQWWSWGTEQQQVFKAAKEALETDTLLVHYDPSKPLAIACNASQYGIGAVLSHVQDDGSDR